MVRVLSSDYRPMNLKKLPRFDHHFTSNLTVNEILFGVVSKNYDFTEVATHILLGLIWNKTNEGRNSLFCKNTSGMTWRHNSKVTRHKITYFTASILWQGKEKFQTSGFILWIHMTTNFRKKSVEETTYKTLSEWFLSL